MMKIAVTGKGGVGKTTLSALLCHSFRRAGYRILAVDADPDANLAVTLGFPEPDRIIPVTDMKELIADRTGTSGGNAGLLFKLNPRVDDIPDRFGVVHDGVRLLVMGRVKKAGTGCYCPENAFIRELLGHLLLEQNDTVILDMEAGIEHLGRGTTGDVDAFIVVVEPGKRSLETAERIIGLSTDLGIRHHYIIANKIRNEADRAFITRYCNAENIIGFLPYSDVVLASNQGDNGVHLEDTKEIDTIRDTLIHGDLHGRE